MGSVSQKGLNTNLKGRFYDSKNQSTHCSPEGRQLPITTKKSTPQHLSFNALGAFWRHSLAHNCAAIRIASEDDADNLEPILYLALNCKVTLRRNFWVSKGLVNRAIGRVEKIVYAPNTRSPDDQPVCILVRFERYSGPTIDGCAPFAASRSHHRAQVTRTDSASRRCKNRPNNVLSRVKLCGLVMK